METVRNEQKIKSLLSLVAQQGASDLHLTVGRHPTLRIDGRLFPLTQEEVLTPEDTKALSDAIIPGKEDKNTLSEKGQVDFSYDFEGKARFRTNVFFSKRIYQCGDAFDSPGNKRFKQIEFAG